jgi:hypothetical protein
MARACTACARAQHVKTPQLLWRVVFFYWGVAKSLRATAADFPRLYESLPDSSRAERLAAGRPWGQAVLATRLPTQTGATLPAPWRCLGIDGRPVPGPGAPGPQERRHLCLAWVQGQWVALTVTDQPPGASLTPWP